MNNGHVFTANSSGFSMVTKQCMSLPDDNTNMLYTQYSQKYVRSMRFQGQWHNHTNIYFHSYFYIV